MKQESFPNVTAEIVCLPPKIEREEGASISKESLKYSDI